MAAAGQLSPEEFGALFVAHRKTLWCIAAAVISDRSGADDILQEAAAVALGKLDQFDRNTSFGAWTGQIVRFTALNELRRRQRSTSTPTDPDVLATITPARPTLEPKPAMDIVGRLSSEQSAFDDTVAAALGQLDEVARSCLLLKTVRELPYSEIAAILDIPEGTAMSHVHRARAAMRRTLSEAQQGKEARS